MRGVVCVGSVIYRAEEGRLRLAQIGVSLRVRMLLWMGM